MLKLLSPNCFGALLLGLVGLARGTKDVLDETVAQPQQGKITRLVRNFDSVESHRIEYAGGLRYPHLERIPGTKNYLSEILEPGKNRE